MMDLKPYILWMAGIAFVLVVAFSIAGRNNSSDNTCELDTPTAPAVYRFQKQRQFQFRDKDITRATIYLDTETGIKYLFIWRGSGHGSPSITRLWEKEKIPQ